jgi:RNase P/RNase MRP subunit POP5
MKALPPTLRQNRRYLCVHGSRVHISAAILEGVGTIGWARAAPVFVSEKDGRTIMAVAREELTMVRAALGLAKEDLPVLRVSGTLKGLEGQHTHKT